jgi:hypothetical protein
VSWLETSSESFTARHDEQDAKGAAAVLELLERTRERLLDAFPRQPEDVAVILHTSEPQLTLAQPMLPVVRALTERPMRRYVAGWMSKDAVHVLAPRLLAARASQARGSRQMLMRTPAALYVQLVIAANNELLPPPFRPASTARFLRWAWLAAGAGQYFSGQLEFAGAAIARRLRDGRAPEFPPARRDALLLGGTVFDLLSLEEGEEAAVALAGRLPAGGPAQALRGAFPGRSLSHTEAAWRSHLRRLAEA